MITIDQLIGLLPSILAAVGVYAAVRADLAKLSARVDAQDRRLDGTDREIGVLRQWLHSIRGDL
jgi:hypothetical protein